MSGRSPDLLRLWPGSACRAGLSLLGLPSWHAAAEWTRNLFKWETPELSYRIQLPIIPTSLEKQLGHLWTQPARVLWDSDKRLHLMVEKLAKYFRREFQYDSIQYSARESMEKNGTQEAFLWTNDPGCRHFAIGACCFRWRVWTNAPPGWALQWIWLHPYERNRGRLTRAWPYFQDRFGDFHVEPPLSPAMRAFLARQTRDVDRGVP